MSKISLSIEKKYKFINIENILILYGELEYFKKIEK